MFRRQLNILKSQTFFLFGPRGTGKSTLLRGLIPEEKSLWIDLLSARDEAAYAQNPDRLSEQLAALKGKIEWVVIDEVQKVPKLLDVVHREIERTSIKFALTGSSARKLHRGFANLLAGRAFVYNLFPLTHRELGEKFSLLDALSWGTLPRLVGLESAEEMSIFLEAYAHTYFKEEIVAEQIVRQVEPFRRFLEVAAQANGAILNYKKISEDVKIDAKTVKVYFEILEDTLLGFFLPAYHRSLRKQQRSAPKFYLFDTGVRRVLERQHMLPLQDSTYEYGRTFEHFVICEAQRLNAYARKNFKFSYLQTGSGLEIDLVVERPGLPTALVEIKSAETILERHIEPLQSLLSDHPKHDAICLSRERHPRKIGKIHVYPWAEGLAELGLV